jgi:hypothetical protein
MLKIRTHKYRVVLLAACCFARFAKSSPFFAKYLSRVADRRTNVQRERRSSEKRLEVDGRVYGTSEDGQVNPTGFGRHWRALVL